MRCNKVGVFVDPTGRLWFRYPGETSWGQLPQTKEQERWLIDNLEF